VTSIHDHVRSYITLLMLKLYMKSNDFSKSPLLQNPTSYHSHIISSESPCQTQSHHTAPMAHCTSTFASSQLPITYKNARRQNAVLLSVLAAGGAGYWLIKARSQQRDQKRQEQIYIQNREHINTTTKGDH
jgi:hypothetical protein